MGIFADSMPKITDEEFKEFLDLMHEKTHQGLMKNLKRVERTKGGITLHFGFSVYLWELAEANATAESIGLNQYCIYTTIEPYNDES